ncbi:MAG TPA: membrane protein insertase YidC, partial [Stellaceae bacterium]|nr:membrane protein insertase YidC [Stellaceae bacterium]
MEDQQKNLFLVIALTLAIIIGFQVFVEPYFQKAKPPQPQPTQSSQTTTPATPSAATPATPGSAPTPGAAAAPSAKTRAEVLAGSPRIAIDTPRLHGSIALVGARLDDLTLATYHETVDPKSPEIVLLSPSGTDAPYFIETGWT